MAGLGAGAQFGHITVNGPALLAGQLALQLVNNYEPNLGDIFQIITAGARTGTFSATNGVSIGNGKQFSVGYTATGVTLHVTP